jgi:nitrous oxidase accessory protein
MNLTITSLQFILAKSSFIEISNNKIHSNASRETTSGNGIHLWYCKNIKILKNTISGHRDGIYLEFVEDSFISENTSSKNLRYGLHFMFSHGCEYRTNKFLENGSGVAVMYTRNVKMINNQFIKNWGSASFGLLLKEIYDSEISGNYFKKNTTGLFIEASNRINIYRNQWLENGFAIKIMANAMENKIHENNFISNTFDVVTNSQQNFSTFYKNYWSSYKGYDLNKDNFGDNPHYPVRLFSIISQKQEASMLLLHSPFLKILELSESVFPTITPKTLKDDSARMRQYDYF